MSDVSIIKIDSTSASVKDSVARTPTFTQASTRANIASGESLSTLFGKIMKWYDDLKSVAFSGSYNDLSNKPTIPTSTSDLTNNKFVQYDTASQGLTSTQQSNARTNIGAGTSSFSGSYNDLSNKPTIPAIGSVINKSVNNQSVGANTWTTFTIPHNQGTDKLLLSGFGVSGSVDVVPFACYCDSTNYYISVRNYTANALSGLTPFVLFCKIS